MSKTNLFTKSTRQKVVHEKSLYEAIERNSLMLKKAEAKPALKCDGSASKLASIFEGLILADNKNKRDTNQTQYRNLGVY